MQKAYDESQPIYLQVGSRMKEQILSGVWTAGMRIPAVRELAVAFGVNPNTMQRALSDLEREGLLRSERTAGRFVTQDTGQIASLRDAEAHRETAAFLQRMAALGYSAAQIAQWISEGGDSYGIG